MEDNEALLLILKMRLEFSLLKKSINPSHNNLNKIVMSEIAVEIVMAYNSLK